MKVIRNTLMLLSITLLCACNSNHKPNEQRAIYHWKNTFDLTEAEQQFLKEHNIGKMYVRFFDVQCEYPKGAVPTARVHFYGKIPKDIEIIPTIYITIDALDIAENQEWELAKKIYGYVQDMIKYNHIATVKEIQIDCDWTKSKQDSYFILCQSLKDLMIPDSLLLSSTIRLHQLALPIPPVDKGVLMLYNTGNIKDPQENNSILEYEDVKAYIKNNNYALPLDFAYPIFSWGVIYEKDAYFGDQLVHLTHDKDYKCRPNQFMRWEEAEMKDLHKVKKLIEKHWGNTPHTTILYHLNEKELSRYTNKDIEYLYN